MARPLLTVFLASQALLACCFGLAQAKDLYPFDLKTKRPDLYKAYRSIVPKTLANLSWFAELNGVSVPLKNEQATGKSYVYGTACQPHNCNMSYVNFLITGDGSRAVAMYVDSEKIEGAVLFAGNPTNDEKISLLDQQFFR